MKLDPFTAGTFKVKKPKKPAPVQSQPAEPKSLIAFFGKTGFAISEKVAKKMGVKMGGQLSENQVDELLKEKK